ncbi:MAG: gluconate 2-dehydrogenase subunit 3 family protein [Saprospirales bacterium]|nr:gluconate 2-dehydrogenase subunit 3 family protein [Saprospirales bacterium]
MNRREIIKRMAAVVGGTLLGADHILARGIDWDTLAERPPGAGVGLFGKRQVRLLNEIAETILPETGTPGAKAARVGQFIALIVSDCYEDADQKVFSDGLAALDTQCRKQYGKPFLRCTPAQRTELLGQLDAEQKAYYKTNRAGAPPHYFRMMKDLTLWGYFTSEIGATQALQSVEIPGRYEGCVPHSIGDRAWGEF